MSYPMLRQTLIPWLLRRVDIQGAEHVPALPPFIVAANHLSYLDAPLLASLMARLRDQQTFFLTKLPVVKLFRPIGGENWLGMIPVDPTHKSLALQPALQRLSERKVVGIFPEGTRNRNPNELLKGKTGAARLALLSGAPILPVGLKGPTGLSSGQAIRIALFGGARLEVRIGPPLIFEKRTPETLTKDLLTQTTRQIMQALGRLCDKTYPF